MSDDLFIDEARIELEDGTTLSQWSDYTINSDYLTPTDGWSFTFAPNFNKKPYWESIRNQLQPDYRIRIYVADKLQLTGWIDAVTINSSHSGGLTVNVQGRDILKVLVKSNIHPDFKIKDRTIKAVMEDIIAAYYPQDPPKLTIMDKEDRTIAGIASKHQGKRTIEAIQRKLSQVQAHPHEGVFEFLQRNLRPYGLWLWASADGNIIVGYPDYAQEPSYKIRRKMGQPHEHVTVVDSKFVHDRTIMPTSITIWGRGVQKEFQKSRLVASIVDPLARTGFEREGFREPIYIRHDQATTSEACYAYAWQELSRHREREIYYSCTCVGHTDKYTGNVYNIGTIAEIDDDYIGLHTPMYVTERTFHKNASGTTTELKMVPLNSILFFDVDTPTEKVKPKTKEEKKAAPEELVCAPRSDWDKRKPA